MMRPCLRLCWPALLLLTISAPALRAQAPSTVERARIDRAIEAQYARFSEGYRRADAGAVAEVYSEDAFYLLPEQDVLRGRAAVRDDFARFLAPFAARGGAGPEIRFDITEREVSGDLAYDVGYYRIGTGDRGGKFLVVWRRETDGVWRILADAQSTLRPARRPPPPPRPAPVDSLDP